jgi:DNA-binding PadR family transcriptional regulator
MRPTATESGIKQMDALEDQVQRVTRRGRECIQELRQQDTSVNHMERIFWHLWRQQQNNGKEEARNETNDHNDDDDDEL